MEYWTVWFRKKLKAGDRYARVDLPRDREKKKGRGIFSTAEGIFPDRRFMGEVDSTNGFHTKGDKDI